MNDAARNGFVQTPKVVAMILTSFNDKARSVHQATTTNLGWLGGGRSTDLSGQGSQAGNSWKGGFLGLSQDVLVDVNEPETPT